MYVQNNFLMLPHDDGLQWAKQITVLAVVRIIYQICYIGIDLVSELCPMIKR